MNLEAGTGDGTLATLHVALHDLCQPLTALLCLLEMASLDRNPERVSELIGCALQETERLRSTAVHMREIVQTARRSES